MARKYTTYTPEKKFKIALEASHKNQTINQIASKYKVHSSQVSDWKKQLLESGKDFFRTKQTRKSCEPTEDIEFLQQLEGKLKVELDWLKN